MLHSQLCHDLPMEVEICDDDFSFKRSHFMEMNDLDSIEEHSATKNISNKVKN